MNNFFSKLSSVHFRPSFESLYKLSVVISPTFLLTVSGWMTRIVAVCALLALYVFFKHKRDIQKNAYAHQNAFDIKLLSIVFGLPIVAIFISQAFRGEFSWAYYDSPMHLLVCVVVMWAMLKSDARLVERMSYFFPLVTLLALVNVLINPNLFWGASRLATQAVDPLMFGSLSLTFGLMSLISIKLHRNHSTLLILYKLIGVGVGVYLSIASGSRTGWLAVPVIGYLWIYCERAQLTRLAKLSAVLGVPIFVIASFFLSDTIHQRVDVAAQEVLSYQWHEKNENTSVGARMSFARIAVFLFEKRPLGGWGDGNFESVMNAPEINFADISTKTTALQAGFHNDITANMVRSGVWGLISTLALFFVPAIFFAKNLASEDRLTRSVAFLAISFLICQCVSSLSMEIFNLRYSASFYGLMVAIFCGQILFLKSRNTINSVGESQ